MDNESISHCPRARNPKAFGKERVLALQVFDKYQVWSVTGREGDTYVRKTQRGFAVYKITSIREYPEGGNSSLMFERFDRISL